MADPLIDVRIAAWLVSPDKDMVKEGSEGAKLQGLLEGNAGKDAVVAATAVVQKVSGAYTFPTCRRLSPAIKLHSSLDGGNCTLSITFSFHKCSIYSQPSVILTS